MTKNISSQQDLEACINKIKSSDVQFKYRMNQIILESSDYLRKVVAKDVQVKAYKQQLEKNAKRLNQELVGQEYRFPTTSDKLVDLAINIYQENNKTINLTGSNYPFSQRKSDENYNPPQRLVNT